MEGYDPDAIREQIRDMTGLEDTDDLIRLAGRGGNGRDYDYINTMRRQQYAKNKDVINAQKRAAYIKRRLVPGFSGIIGEGEREYSREEIIEIAKETKQVADKHIPGIESRWSGQIEIEEKKTPGKLWNCDIRTPSRTSPHALLHQQIHAKSISLYGEKNGPQIYLKLRKLEEASVQYACQEISMKEGIPVIKSKYDDIVNDLRDIKDIAFPEYSDYQFAKKLIEQPLLVRLELIRKKAYLLPLEKSNETFKKMEIFE